MITLSSVHRSWKEINCVFCTPTTGKNSTGDKKIVMQLKETEKASCRLTYVEVIDTKMRTVIVLERMHCTLMHVKLQYLSDQTHHLFHSLSDEAYIC